MSRFVVQIVPWCLCVLLLPPVACAQSVSAWCDDAAHIVVLAPNDSSRTEPWATGEWAKEMTEGGGLAGLGYKGYVLSNTISRPGTLDFLQGLNARLATPGVAAVVEDLVRSSAFKVGAVGAAAVGGFLVLHDFFGDNAPPPDKAGQELSDNIRQLGLGYMHLMPCPDRPLFNRNGITTGGVAPSGNWRPPDNASAPIVAPDVAPAPDLYNFSGAAPTGR